MPTIQVSANDLLDAVKQMPPDERERFLQEALSLRAEPRGVALSAEETELIGRINRGLADSVRKRLSRLSRRRKNGTLTPAEHAELLRLTNEAETLDAERAAALVELARLRGLVVRTLMKQMGIKTPPIRG